MVKWYYQTILPIERKINGLSQENRSWDTLNVGNMKVFGEKMVKVLKMKISRKI